MKMKHPADDVNARANIPREWLQEFEAAAQRPLETPLRRHGSVMRTPLAKASRPIFRKRLNGMSGRRSRGMAERPGC